MMRFAALTGILRRWLYDRISACVCAWSYVVSYGHLAQRKNNRLLAECFAVLRDAFKHGRERHPYRTHALVVLPDHLHCVWTLPPGDTDFSMRWGLIKAHCSRSIDKCEWRSSSRIARGERGLWQRRFWEHLIRDQVDFNRHVDYIHWNPVKHGWVRRVSDWPNSTVHEYVERGLYPADWGGDGIGDSKMDAGE